jgi:hypothetical protein
MIFTDLRGNDFLESRFSWLDRIGDLCYTSLTSQYRDDRLGAGTMKQEKGEATATVKDFSNGQDGSKEVDVPYSFEYNVLENAQELANEFSPAKLLELANARIKSTANSAARQKAVSPYAQDPDAPAAIRERMIKDAMKAGKSREIAEKFVDSLFA